jgi:hypothetical protein
MGDSPGGEKMRNSTETIKHAHIRMPAIKELRESMEKAFASEKGIDAALLTLAIMLCGWLIYCLARPISECRYML